MYSECTQSVLRVYSESVQSVLLRVTYAEICAYVRGSIVLAHLGATAWPLHTYCGALWQYVLLAELKKIKLLFCESNPFLVAKDLCVYLLLLQHCNNCCSVSLRQDNG